MMLQSIHGAYTHERCLASGRLFLPDRFRRNYVDKLLHLLLLSCLRADSLHTRRSECNNASSSGSGSLAVSTMQPGITLASNLQPVVKPAASSHWPFIIIVGTCV